MKARTARLPVNTTRARTHSGLTKNPEDENNNLPVFTENGLHYLKKSLSGTGDDRYEREADWIAERVIQMPHPGNRQSAGLPGSNKDAIRHLPAGKGESIQRKPGSENRETVTTSLAAKIAGRTRHTGEPGPGKREDFLKSPGRPLSGAVQTRFESRFGFDFRRVRIHSDEEAARTASAINARAFTLKNDILFNTGEYNPGTISGNRLLAHELAHVIQQQTSDNVPGIQREKTFAGFFRNLGRTLLKIITFGQVELDYDREDLIEYWKIIKTTIENDFDSDLKARNVVRLWKAGDPAFKLTPIQKANLIHEMKEGWTSGADEKAILDILNGSSRDELKEMFTRGGLSAKRLRQDFDGKNLKKLNTLLLQIQPDKSMCYDPSLPSSSIPDIGECAPWAPENCPTYEKWLAGFFGMRTFKARDTAPGGSKITGFNVLGIRAKRPVDPGTSKASEQPPSPVKKQYAGDKFIDKPTDDWVKKCLPKNLRQTAYLLPADCADIALILRHVWLSAHHRTEQVAGYTLGDVQGRAQQSRMLSAIQAIQTTEVHKMVQAYSDAQGNPLRSFAEVSPLLHPGDVLVWEHHAGGGGKIRGPCGSRTGGHTQTITYIKRDAAGKVTEIYVLQGNQPISPLTIIGGQSYGGQVKEIQTYQQKEHGRKSTKSELRYSPGRRIEASVRTMSHFNDKTCQITRGKNKKTITVWTTADGHTTLVAAGPPGGVSRPVLYRRRKRLPRKVSDWFPRLKGTTSQASLLRNFEAALYELRAFIESGQTGLENDAKQLGQTAGEQFWKFARRRSELGEKTHYRPLLQIQKIINTLAAASHVQTAYSKRVFSPLYDAFTRAARGFTEIKFERGGRKNLIKVLVTGFDPFSNTLEVPAGTINPSGAAAMYLDNTRLYEGTTKSHIAVEGIVLPVDYDAFRGGLVEKIVRPLIRSRGVDSIITVSLDESIKPRDPVALERFVVGVHTDRGGEAIPPVPGSKKIGPAIMEVDVPLQQIAAQTRQRNIPQPQVRTGIIFRFSSVAQANQALTALGLPSQGLAQVTISNVSALQRIAALAQRIPKGRDIQFTIGSQTFRTEVIKGPGGAYLSNEVSYRMLRLLTEEGRTDIPSFHVHVQRPLPKARAVIPQDRSTKDARRKQKAAITHASGVVKRLITTLQSMIRAVAKNIVSTRRGP